MRVIVLGMHRSGTSALARVIGLLGCHVGEDPRFPAPDAANLKGYWERRDVWAVNERALAEAGGSWCDVASLDFEAITPEARGEIGAEIKRIVARLDGTIPWVIKDPRLSLTLPLWRPAVEDAVCVVIHRRPLDVALSLRARDSFPIGLGLALWEAYNLGCLSNTRGLPRMLISYEELLARPLEVAREIADGLRAAGVSGLRARDSLPEEEIRSFIDSALRHQGSEDVLQEAYLTPPQSELHHRMADRSALELDPVPPLSPGAREELSRLSESLREEARRNGLREEASRSVTVLEALVHDKDRYIRSLESWKREREDSERRLAAPRAWSEFAVATIISKNYLSLARTVCESFRRHHPGARAYVLLVDHNDGAFDPRLEEFETVEVEDLGIPNFSDFSFKYDILELNTAVKPYFLEYLFDKRQVSRLFYLDPDILVLSAFEEARDALEVSDALLTPHILSPLFPDGRRPNEHDLLMSGIYNLGFLGLRRSETTYALLEWWRSRLYDAAFHDVVRGLFTDQKWMNLAPAIFPGVGILRKVGYNVAYWNLQERSRLERSDDGALQVAGEPLRFFHFSGFEKGRPNSVSKFQDRYRLPDLTRHHRALFQHYAAILDARGFQETRHWRYAYGCFDNGIPIAQIVRRLYWNLGDDRFRFGNAFETSGDGSFFAWLMAPRFEGSPLSNLVYHLYRIRSDLPPAFPDPDRADALAFLQWVLDHAAADFQLGDAYRPYFQRAFEDERARREPVVPEAAPVGDETTSQEVASPESSEVALPPAALAEHEWVDAEPSVAWKRKVRDWLGKERYQRLRWRVWRFYARFPRATGSSRSASPGAVSSEAEPQPEPAAGDPAPASARSHSSAKTAGAQRPFGVNLFGYFDTESGVGEIARSLAVMLRASEIPHALINVEQDWLRREDRTIRGLSSKGCYSVNLMAVNADQTARLVSQHSLARGNGHFNVGYWFWELSRLPEVGERALSFVDEVWVASDFCREALVRSDVPAVKIRPALSFEPARRRGREHFGFDDADFVFLFVFDSLSVLKRKNPAGLISAFRRAFGPDEPVRLVLKTTNATERQVSALERLAGRSRVQVWNGYLGRAELLDLIAAADAYASLHRSEGLGLTALEALMLDKPAVLTAYSGVAEFLDAPLAYAVPFREVPLNRDHGPYRKGNVWAEPDLDEAARLMRVVYERFAKRSSNGSVGESESPSAELRRRFSLPATVGALAERLRTIERILERRHAVATG